MRANLTYEESYSLTTASLPSDYRTFSVGGAYDPLYTIGGGTCTGFPLYANIYKKYYVESVMIKVHFVNLSINSPGYEYRAFIRAIPSSQITAIPSTAAFTVSDASEAQGAFCAVISPSTRPDSACVLTAQYVPYAIEGLPSMLVDYASMSAGTTTVPVRTPVIIAGVVGLQGAKASAIADMTVTLHYGVRFYDPTMASAN